MLSTIDRGLSSTQQRKLRRLLAEAVNHVPFYRQSWKELGLSSDELTDPAVLARLPVLTKAELAGVPARERVSERFHPRRLAEESTTGSTGQPFSLYLDAAYRRRRNARFLRALLSAGYRPWQRLMLLTDRHPGSGLRRGRLHYVSVEQPTGAIAEACARIRPAVLYGFATPLRLLAEHLREAGTDYPRPRLVISTAEVLDSATRSTLETAFGCPVADFYGMTEMGLVAWKRPGDTGYLMSHNAVVTELVPEASCPGRYRMLMTNLDLLASPLIRFDSGDLAIVEDVDGAPMVTVIEGRRIDTIVCRDGSELSPYRITDALRDVAGLRRFRVTQRRTTEFAVEIEADPCMREAIAAQITTIFDSLLGENLQLDFTYSDRLVPEGARKFRPVASEVPRP